ncbi:ATP/GTP-binding protein [Asanoa sp. WMMD1127]|uniref:AAA family ATPase n=1 Tax=Asanoa sp. WMMD1127 TaxID=3016107 RepID=UPI002417E616|nr:AAA family ATPase [Asanoa sp. WMMD1127]MDG4824610.1 ATP/GTP-binding protein [Asanoa sp. WMMD1127]
MLAMIVWVNGAFGAGKTTTAGLVVKGLDGATLFDPEYVGFMLMPFVKSPTGDFQDLPLWRHLVVETMVGLAQQYPHPWVAPMSLINAGYRAEILGGIRRAGVDVREFVLAVPEEILRPRIDADQVEAKARQWRQDHVAQALTTFAALTDATFVDATRPPERVADDILTRLR